MVSLRRLLRREQPPPADDAVCGPRRREPGTIGDDVPRTAIAEPVSVVDLEALPAEHLDDGQLRITFWLNVRDHAGRRCPDVAVDARVDGPERSGEGLVWTDAYGQARIRTTGPPGVYRCEITGVGAGALEVVTDDAGVIAATTAEVPATGA